MTQTAKQYAQSQLGNLDLSYLNNEKDAAQNTYNTSKSSLENNFNNLLEQISNNKADTRKNFNTGRATVAENSYNTNKNNEADLASRGVGSSGLKGLGEVGNRMETGKQYSNLANNFYSSMNDLDTTEKQGKSQYDLDQQTAKNTLDNTLAGINSHGAEAQNNYNMTLGQLAEAVQGRWDSNSNAEKALAQSTAAAAQSHNDAVNAAKQNLQSAKRQALTNITNMKDADGNRISTDSMLSQIQTTFGVDSTMASNVLKELGILPTKTFSYDANNPYTPTNYVNQIFGGY